MVGFYALIFVGLVVIIAGGFALSNGNVTGVAFIAFGLMLGALGMKQVSMLKKKGGDDA